MLPLQRRPYSVLLCSLAIFFLVGLKSATGSTSPSGLPDLVVRLSWTPPAPQIGQDLTISVKVANEGNATTRDYCVYFYIDPVERPPTLRTQDTSVHCNYTQLPTGGYIIWSLGHTFVTPGEHRIYAWVDRNNFIRELNEENNLMFVDISVGGSASCLEDAYELDDSWNRPDDSCGKAKPTVADGVHTRHTLCPQGDEDWIRIDAVQGLSYSVRTSNEGADADTTITLYDFCNEDPIQNSEPTLGGGEMIEFQADLTGPHYVRVKHHDESYGPDTHYDLAVDVRCQGDAYEPDDTCPIARETVIDGGSQDHLFCSQGDQDWMRFQATAGMTYRFSLENVGPAAQPRLAIYPACDTYPLLEEGVGETLEWQPEASGLYYLRAGDAIPSSYGSTAFYRLRLAAEGNDPDDPGNDSPLPTNGAPVQGAISKPGDQDWFFFEGLAGQSYRFETFGLDPVADTVLCIYGLDRQTSLLCDDDSGEGLGSRLWWQAPANGRFLLKVYDYRQEVGGTEARYSITALAGAPLCDLDDAEPDNIHTQASQIETNGIWQRHSTCGEGDADWVWFQAVAGQAYTIETDHLGIDADTVLTLYDTDGRTPLWSNDDVGRGRASAILWRFQRNGVYYLKIEPFAATGIGRGSDYDLRILPSGIIPTPLPTVQPTSTPTPTVTPMPTPTATQSPMAPSAHTLIITNHERFTSLYGQAGADALMQALTRLAGHEAVQGVVVDVSADPMASGAYVLWNADPTNIAKANQVADAVRSVVVRHMQRSPNLEYIVLAGDDRVIPHRRVADRPELLRFHEGDYPYIDATTTVGSAIKQDQSLNDDFYADRVLTSWQGQPIYVPDYAIGRVVETPTDIIGMINSFIVRPSVRIERVMVAGYGPRLDGSQEICDVLRGAVTSAGLDCELLGGNWDARALQQKQLEASPRFDIQALGTGSRHFYESSPAGDWTTAQQIATATIDLAGVLAWNMGSHTGLNVSPPNPISALDLPEAFARKSANYIGNTGSGLASNSKVLMTERLLSMFAAEFSIGTQTQIGKAWMHAKQRYYLLTPDFGEYDRKVLSVATFYGLPMATLIHSGTFPGLPFPSVNAGFDSPGNDGTLGAPQTHVLETYRLSMQDGIETYDAHTTAQGNYFSLDDSVALTPNQPVQPLFWADTDEWRRGPLRGVVWKSGVYTDVPDFEPLRPEVGVIDDSGELAQALPASTAGPLQGPAPSAVLRGDYGELFSLQMGQYDEPTQTERLYDQMTFDVYFGTSPDHTPPAVTWLAGRREGNLARIKVEADDLSGVRGVIATYTHNNGLFVSMDLDYDPFLGKWVGEIPLQGQVQWQVSVIDGVGNVALLNNKGHLYALASLRELYLPIMLKP